MSTNWKDADDKITKQLNGLAEEINVLISADKSRTGASCDPLIGPFRLHIRNGMINIFISTHTLSDPITFDRRETLTKELMLQRVLMSLERMQERLDAAFEILEPLYCKDKPNPEVKT